MSAEPELKESTFVPTYTLYYGKKNDFDCRKG